MAPFTAFSLIMGRLPKLPSAHGRIKSKEPLFTASKEGSVSSSDRYQVNLKLIDHGCRDHRFPSISLRHLSHPVSSLRDAEPVSKISVKESWSNHGVQ